MTSRFDGAIAALDLKNNIDADIASHPFRPMRTLSLAGELKPARHHTASQ